MLVLNVQVEKSKKQLEHHKYLNNNIHKPVLLNEVIEYLNLKPNYKIIDATFGAGGHGIAIAEKIAPNGLALGIEPDSELLKEAESRIKKHGLRKNLVLVNGSYADLKKIAEENGFIGADGVLFDLGLSSWHLEKSGRGFSFLKDELLDMRFSKDTELTAAEIVNQWPPKEVKRILKDYGEEKFAGQISKSIIEARKKKPVTSTFQLVEVIESAVPLWYRKGRPRSRNFGSLRGRRINCATKTFQALRIAVNGELENLKTGLKQIPKVLKKKSRAAVISFHSLEDRIVKKTFRDFQKMGIGEIVVKKPIRPSAEEIFENPRSRSARMRIIEIS